MSLSTILRIVLRRWYIVIPGVLLSLIIASTVFDSIPPKYTSSGIAVMVRQNNPTTTNVVNPALGGDGTFTTATLTLVQALDTPAVKAGLGLREGVDNFTVNNVGKAASSGGLDHPFLYITTESSNPETSTRIVDDVINVARQKLAAMQNDAHVRPQNQVKLETVVDATAPIAAMDTVFAAAGGALMAGIVMTCIVACAWDRLVVGRQKRQMHQSNFRANEKADQQVGARHVA